MSSVDDILNALPLDALASKLGVDEQTIASAVQTALPALVSGMQANATSGSGADLLAAALGKHDASLIDGGVNLDQVDDADGANIVKHVFGDQSEAVVSQLGGVQGAGGQDLIGKLLPMLAPIVMSYLAKRVLGGGGASNQQASGSAVTDVLGQILGGAKGGGGSAGGLDLGKILGGLLGAGSR